MKLDGEKIAPAEIFEGHWHVLYKHPHPPLPLSPSLSIIAPLKEAIMLLTMFSCPYISASLAALIVPLIGENKEMAACSDSQQRTVSGLCTYRSLSHMEQ